MTGFKWATAVSVVALVAALSACGTSAPTGATATASAAETASALSSMTLGEADYLRDMRNSRSETLKNLHDYELIVTSRIVCSRIGETGLTKSTMLQLFPSYGMAAMNIIVTAAQARICPEKKWWVEPETLAAPTALPAPAGPATRITSDGVYEVGVDIAAGRYKTPGTAQTCYWRRSPIDNSSKILENHLGDGAAIATVKVGEQFETKRCGVWTRSG